MTNTLKALNRVPDSGVGRSDLYTCHPHKLLIEPGYNVRDAYFPDYWDSELAKKRIRGIADAYKRGDHVDPISVEVVDGQVYVRSGEHRTRALWLAMSEGWECDKTHVIQMAVPRDGKKPAKEEDTEMARLLILTTGNSGAPLTPIEQGVVYTKLRDQMRLSDQEIADKVGVSREYVRICRAYLKMPTELIQMCAKGEIAPKKALSLFRLHGGLAVQIAQGKTEAPKVPSTAAERRRTTLEAANELAEAWEELGWELSNTAVGKRIRAAIDKLEKALHGAKEKGSE